MHKKIVSTCSPNTNMYWVCIQYIVKKFPDGLFSVPPYVGRGVKYQMQTCKITNTSFYFKDKQRLKNRVCVFERYEIQRWTFIEVYSWPWRPCLVLVDPSPKALFRCPFLPRKRKRKRARACDDLSDRGRKLYWVTRIFLHRVWTVHY